MPARSAGGNHASWVPPGNGAAIAMDRYGDWMSGYGAVFPAGERVRGRGWGETGSWIDPWQILRRITPRRHAPASGAEPALTSAQPLPHQTQPVPQPTRGAAPGAEPGGEQHPQPGEAAAGGGVRGPRYPAPRAPEPGTTGTTGPDAVGEPPEAGSTWFLVEQAQQGDAEAFGQLYDRYVDLVHRFIYYRVGDRGTAEDFTSETFLRAWRRIGSVSNQGRDIGAWFVTIARNIILDHVKSSRYKLEVTTADMLDADTAEDGPEGTVLDRLAHTELLRCVQRLNPEQQECIVLRFLEGLSVAETAQVMGKNEGAIKALQHRAVRRLATLLPAGLR